MAMWKVIKLSYLQQIYEHEVDNYITFYDRCIISSFSSNQQMWSCSCFSYPAFPPSHLKLFRFTYCILLLAATSKNSIKLPYKILKNESEIFITF